MEIRTDLNKAMKYLILDILRDAPDFSAWYNNTGDGEPVVYYSPVDGQQSYKLRGVWKNSGNHSKIDETRKTPLLVCSIFDLLLSIEPQTPYITVPKIDNVVNIHTNYFDNDCPLWLNTYADLAAD